MENKHILYGIGGIIIGAVLVAGITFITNKDTKVSGTHQMPNGSTMSDDDPMDMHGAMQNMMSGLSGKTGDAFDKEFLAEMIVHHEGAVEMARAVLTTSKRTELIKLANDIISAQTGEITMMKEWQKKWFAN